MNRQSSKGFTLIEIAIVLLIVSVILGYTVAMFPIQQELKQYRQAEQEMDGIIEALYAFAQVEGYLPCPANNNVASSGFSCLDGDANLDGDCDGNNPGGESCDIWYGFVPGKTLGINGKYAADGPFQDLLLDPWGMPYRYQVADTDGGVSAGEDFVLTNGIANETIANVNPNLEVCNTDQSPAAAGVEPGCAGAPQTIANNLPAVILSTGKNTDGDVAATSWIQRENLDNSPADRVFISVSFSDTAGAEFDDVVRWVPPNTLYSKMISAGRLP